MISVLGGDGYNRDWQKTVRGGGPYLPTSDWRVFQVVAWGFKARLSTQARGMDDQRVLAGPCFFDDEDRVCRGHGAVKLSWWK